VESIAIVSTIALGRIYCLLTENPMKRDSIKQIGLYVREYFGDTFRYIEKDRGISQIDKMNPSWLEISGEY